MSYNFKKFQQKNARKENRISITKSNSFGYPTKFYEDNNIRSFKYVTLFWDKEKKAIAFRFHNDEDEENKFKIIHSQKYGGSITARSFFKTYNINPKKYHGKYNWKKEKIEDVGKVFVIVLNKKSEPKK